MHVGLEPTQGDGLWEERTLGGGVPIQDKKLMHAQKLDEWIPVLVGGLLASTA